MFVWQNAEEAQHQPEASSQPPHPTSPLCKPRCRALYQYIGQDTDENSASKSMTSFELAQRSQPLLTFFKQFKVVIDFEADLIGGPDHVLEQSSAARCPHGGGGGLGLEEPLAVARCLCFLPHKT
uniref:Uncharacterized protein n=1 Tax=Knipowitschia caucasica TaxID=637954 RepID=A0AAV2MSB2_KNICA